MPRQRPALKRACARYAEDCRRITGALEELSGGPAPEKARELLEKLPETAPEDPALAAEIAGQMAEAFARGSGNPENPENPEKPEAVNSAGGIANPCPKCHRNMPEGGTCGFCARRAANHAAGRAAFGEVAKTHQDKVGAMERDSIGKIDFIWGDDSEGVCHILQGHSETASQIPGVIAYGDVYEDTAQGKYYIIKKRYVVVLRKQTGSNHYLITGFRADSPNYAADIRKECSLVEKGE